MSPIAHDTLAHSNSRFGQLPDAGSAPDAVPVGAAVLGAKRGAGVDEGRAAKLPRKDSGSMSPAVTRLLRAKDRPPRVVESEIGVVAGAFQPVHRQDLSLSQRVKLFVTLLRNIFNKDAYSNWMEQRYEMPNRDKFEQLLDHLDSCKTLTARDLENLRGSLKGPVAQPDYLARIAVGQVQRMGDAQTLRLLKEHLEKLQGAGEPTGNDGFSGAEASAVEPGVAVLGEALSADISNFCKSVLTVVSTSLARVEAQAELEKKKAGLDRTMSELATSLGETNRNVYIERCQKLLSSLNEQVRAYEDDSAALQTRHRQFGQKVEIPPLALDRAVLDNALLKLFGDTSVNDAYSASAIDNTHSLVLSNVVGRQTWLVGLLEKLVPYSDLLSQKAGELARERYAAHEAAGAEAIRDIMAGVSMSGVSGDARDLRSLAGKLRRVLNVIRYTTDKRAELLGRSDGIDLWDIPPALVTAFRAHHGLETPGQELAFGVSKLRTALYGRQLPGVVRQVVPTDAHYMLGWLYDLICEPFENDILPILREEDERAWRDALVCELGLVMNDENERVLIRETLHLQDAFRPYSEGAKAANEIKPHDWISWGAGPDSSAPKHEISKWFKFDVIDRSKYRFALRGVDANGQRVLASMQGGLGHESEIDDFLTAMEKVRPGSVRQLMPYMDQAQFAFISLGLQQAEAIHSPPGNGYSGVSFEIDMRPNGDTLIEIEARYDAMANVSKLLPSGVQDGIQLDPAQSRAMFRKCILVSHYPDGRPEVRQLGPVAMSMTVVPLQQAAATAQANMVAAETPDDMEALDDSWDHVNHASLTPYDGSDARTVADDDSVLDQSFSLVEAAGA
ncbi:hypothetical protein [Bordetella sp. LUAb4]|uniref:hypothetical protein n=1 Tax=Bordetella sp. LUAb4 TaxID=2843195 RepID=UPI001E4D29A2|nr:hypothetical protein [Bordetella sp. LUAb4]